MGWGGIYLRQFSLLRVGVWEYLLGKRILFKLVSQHVDERGRFLKVKCEMFGERYTVINIYKPPISGLIILGVTGIIYSASMIAQVKTEKVIMLLLHVKKLPGT